MSCLLTIAGRLSNECGWILSQEPLVIPHGLHVLAKRWIVQRTLAWLVHNLSLSKFYEWRHETSETLVNLARTRLLIWWLVHQRALDDHIAHQEVFQKASDENFPRLNFKPFGCPRQF
jgi:hypothetical protein